MCNEIPSLIVAGCEQRDLVRFADVCCGYAGVSTSEEATLAGIPYSGSHWQQSAVSQPFRPARPSTGTQPAKHVPSCQCS